MPKIINTKDIIESFVLKHKNKYDYSLVNYKSAKIKVIIICKTHGEFFQAPSHHKMGNGCPTCSNISNGIYFTKNNNIIKDLIIKHKNKYDYSLVKYTKSKDKN